MLYDIHNVFSESGNVCTMWSKKQYQQLFSYCVS